MRIPTILSKGLYWRTVPLILIALSVVMFLTTATLLSTWTIGWVKLAWLLLLSFETFFLPYAFVPIALRGVTLLPWVKIDYGKEFSIDGPDRLAQRTLISALIILPGLPILSAYDRGPQSLIDIPLGLVVAGNGTAYVFIILVAVLAIPDFKPMQPRR